MENLTGRKVAILIEDGFEQGKMVPLGPPPRHLPIL
jgi:hypothetical protein